MWHRGKSYSPRQRRSPGVCKKKEFSGGRRNVHDEQRSRIPSILTDESKTSLFSQLSRTLLYETLTNMLGYLKQNNWHSNIGKTEAIAHMSFLSDLDWKGIIFWALLWLKMKRGWLNTRRRQKDVRHSGVTTIQNHNFGQKIIASVF